MLFADIVSYASHLRLLMTTVMPKAAQSSEVAASHVGSLAE
jgi:hypothetical protein